MSDLPTSEEIAQLPRWASVAFAARCALRVMPRFQIHAHYDGIRDHVVAVREACFFAARCATFGQFSVNSATNFGEEVMLATAAAYETSTFSDPPGLHAASAAESAEAAVEAASDAWHFIDSKNNPTETASAYAWQAADESDEVADAIRRDFDTVLQLSIELNWDDRTGVPQAVFGAMWPTSEPEWYRKGKAWHARALGGGYLTKTVYDNNEKHQEPCFVTDDTPRAQPLQVYFDPEKYSPDEQGEILSVLSRIYRLQTGERLVIDGAGQGMVEFENENSPVGGRS